MCHFWHVYKQVNSITIWHLQVRREFKKEMIGYNTLPVYIIYIGTLKYALIYNLWYSTWSVELALPVVH